RHAQHVCCEHQMDLGSDPDELPRPDHGELTVGVTRVGCGLEGQEQVFRHPLSVTKNGLRLEKSIGIALRTSASNSGVTCHRPWRRAYASTRCITTPRTKDG